VQSRHQIWLFEVIGDIRSFLLLCDLNGTQTSFKNVHSVSWPGVET